MVTASEEEGVTGAPKGLRFLKTVDQGPGRSRYQILMPDLIRTGLHISVHPGEMHVRDSATGATVPVHPERLAESFREGGMIRAFERFRRFPDPGHRVTGWIYRNPQRAKLIGAPSELTVDPKQLVTGVQAFELDDSRDIEGAVQSFIAGGLLKAGGSVVADIEGTKEHFVFYAFDPSEFPHISAPESPNRPLPPFLEQTLRLGGLPMTLPNFDSIDDVANHFPELGDLIPGMAALLSRADGDPDSPKERMNAILRALEPIFEESMEDLPKLKRGREPEKSEDESDRPS